MAAAGVSGLERIIREGLSSGCSRVEFNSSCILNIHSLKIMAAKRLLLTSISSPSWNGKHHFGVLYHPDECRR